jgi:hypothetical protein
MATGFFIFKLLSTDGDNYNRMALLRYKKHFLQKQQQKYLEHAKQLSIQLRAENWSLHTKIIQKYIQYKTIIKNSLLVRTQKMCKGKFTLLRYCIINQGYLITFNYKAKKNMHLYNH